MTNLEKLIKGLALIETWKAAPSITQHDVVMRELLSVIGTLVEIELARLNWNGQSELEGLRWDKPIGPTGRF